METITTHSIGEGDRLAHMSTEPMCVHMGELFLRYKEHSYEDVHVEVQREHT